ncbi:MAG: hypothetical protein Q9227_008367 [Pyrenula ochraceoflavens]
MRALALLKQCSAQASETATEDQASDHTHQNKIQRSSFELDVQEDPPTSDQLRSVLDYLGGDGKAGQVVKGASGLSEALQQIKQNNDAFQRPVIVDWNAGRAVVGDNESEILKLKEQHTPNSPIIRTSTPPSDTLTVRTAIFRGCNSTIRFAEFTALQKIFIRNKKFARLPSMASGHMTSQRNSPNTLQPQNARSPYPSYANAAARGPSFQQRESTISIDGPFQANIFQSGPNLPAQAPPQQCLSATNNRSALPFPGPGMPVFGQQCPEDLLADDFVRYFRTKDPLVSSKMRLENSMDSVFSLDVQREYPRQLLRHAMAIMCAQNAEYETCQATVELAKQKQLTDHLQTALRDAEREISFLREQSSTTAGSSTTDDDSSAHGEVNENVADNFNPNCHVASLSLLTTPRSVARSGSKDDIHLFQERLGFGHAETHGPSFNYDRPTRRTPNGGAHHRQRSNSTSPTRKAMPPMPDILAMNDTSDANSSAKSSEILVGGNVGDVRNEVEAVRPNLTSPGLHDKGADKIKEPSKAIGEPGATRAKTASSKSKGQSTPSCKHSKAAMATSSLTNAVPDISAKAEKATSTNDRGSQKKTTGASFMKPAVPHISFTMAEERFPETPTKTASTTTTNPTPPSTTSTKLGATNDGTVEVTPHKSTSKPKPSSPPALKAESSFNDTEKNTRQSIQNCSHSRIPGRIHDNEQDNIAHKRSYYTNGSAVEQRRKNWLKWKHQMIAQGKWKNEKFWEGREAWKNG